MNFKNNGFGNAANQNQFGSASSLFDKEGVHKQYGLDPGGNNEIGKVFRNTAAYTAGPMASRTAFNAGLEGNYQNAVRQILQRLQNRNYAAEGQRAANQTRAAYGQGQQLADQSARAQGLGQGAQLGSQQGLQSMAARGAAAAEQSWLDPRREDQDLVQALQVLMGTQQDNPYFDTLMQLFAPIEQRNSANAAARAQRGVGGVLGTIGGQLLGGGGLNGLLGGGTYDPTLQQGAGWRPGQFGR